MLVFISCNRQFLCVFNLCISRSNYAAATFLCFLAGSASWGSATFCLAEWNSVKIEILPFSITKRANWLQKKSSDFKYFISLYITNGSLWRPIEAIFEVSMSIYFATSIGWFSKKFNARFTAATPRHQN